MISNTNLELSYYGLPYPVGGGPFQSGELHPEEVVFVAESIDEYHRCELRSEDHFNAKDLEDHKQSVGRPLLVVVVVLLDDGASLDAMSKPLLTPIKGASGTGNDVHNDCTKRVDACRVV